MIHVMMIYVQKNDTFIFRKFVKIRFVCLFGYFTILIILIYNHQFYVNFIYQTFFNYIVFFHLILRNIKTYLLKMLGL